MQKKKSPLSAAHGGRRKIPQEMQKRDIFTSSIILQFTLFYVSQEESVLRKKYFKEPLLLTAAEFVLVGTRIRQVVTCL